MEIVNAKTAPPIDTPHKVHVVKLYDTDNALVNLITLQPGEKLKRHITPVDVFFYVLEGTGIVEIGNEKQEVGPDHLVKSPAKVVHCWYNQGSQTFRVLVVKVPKPKEATQVL
jgi:quercetin dioxygenase-like cupin family protein